MIDEPATIAGDEMSEAILGLVKPELQPGERLLWAEVAGDRPPGVARTSASVFLWIAMSFGVCAVAFYAEFGPFRGKYPRFDGLFFLIGVISGLVGTVVTMTFLAGRVNFWTGHDRSTRRTYALTDRRAIIWVPRKLTTAVEVHAFHRGSIKTIYRVEFPDGSGDLIFGNPMDETSFSPTGFEKIAHVRRAEELIRRTLIDSFPPAIP